MDYKWNIQWILFGLIIFLKDIKSHPKHLENYIEEDRFLPNFITLGQKFSIAIGSTVVLPCKLNVSELSSQYIMAWKGDVAVLTAGNVKVTVNPRLRLIPNDEMQNVEPHTISYNLEIRDVRLIDAGKYTCQIGSMIPREIVHQLEVLTPPKITKMGPNRVDVSKGEIISLMCEAEGNPQPQIIWSRKNNVMPNGEPNITNNIFEIIQADRHSVGHYQCTADNKVGQPDKKDIIVNVKFPPEIESEQLIVHTGIGSEAILTCIVYAEPLANVVWYKDTTQLGITENISRQNHGNRYNLIIRNVSGNDLGNYTCQATNILGKERLSLMLTGVPTICIIDSPSVSSFREMYNMSWSVQSHSPIREYRIFYRKQHTYPNSYHDDEIDNNNIAINYLNEHHKIPKDYYHSVGNIPGINTAAKIGNNNNNNFGTYSQEQEKWKNIILTENLFGFYPNEHQHQYQDSYFSNGVSDDSYHFEGFNKKPKNIRFQSSYLFRNLLPGSNYEVKMQARNDFGWNKLSSVFYFSTKSQNMELKISSEPSVKTAGVLDKDYSSNGNNYLLNKFSILCTLIILYATQC